MTHAQADIIKTISANAKQQGRKRRAEDDAGSDKWTALLDMIDTAAPTDALAAAAAQAAAAVPPARKKDKGSKDKGGKDKSGKGGGKTSSKASAKSDGHDFSSGKVSSKRTSEHVKKVEPESGRIDFDAAAAAAPATTPTLASDEASSSEPKKKRRRKKSKSATATPAASASDTAE
jgi:hypothetical protein